MQREKDSALVREKNRGWREHKEGVKREAFSGFVETPEYNARLGAEEGKGSKERGAGGVKRKGRDEEEGKEVRRGDAGGVKRMGRTEEEGKEVSRGGTGGRGKTSRRNTWRSDGEENVEWRENVWNRAKKKNVTIEERKGKGKRLRKGNRGKMKVKKNT